jgi:hypothetical protein
VIAGMFSQHARDTEALDDARERALKLVTREDS